MEPVQAEPVLAGGLLVLAVILMGLFFAVLGALITVIPFWKICSKAGFSGALSLLMLVPIANVVLPFYLAFAPWPSLENNSQEAAVDV